MRGSFVGEQSLASEIKGLRLAKGMSREQLAVRAGLSSSTIERIELQGRIPKLPTLRSLAAALDTPVQRLVAVAAEEAA